MKKFVPNRLKEARELAGMTAASLAGELGITPAAVGKWQKGTAVPKDGHISRMAEVLSVPAPFFFRSEKRVELEGRLQFRATTRRVKRDTLKVTRLLEYFAESAEAFLDMFEIPEFEDPFNDEFDPLQLEPHEVESMASDLRSAWNLGTSPIKTLGNLLFNKGIVLLRADLPKSMSGFSFFSGGRPFIVIGDQSERSRDKLTIAHELAHILLHHGKLDGDLGALRSDKHKKAELDAFRFAGAFLLPAKEFLDDVFSHSIECLYTTKKKWQVSVAAQIRRLSDLGEISEDRYHQLMKNLSWRGERTKEKSESSITAEPCDQIEKLMKRLRDGRPDLWDSFKVNLAALPLACVSFWIVDMDDHSSKILEFDPSRIGIAEG